MKKAFRFFGWILAVGLIVGGVWKDYGPPLPDVAMPSWIEWCFGASKPVMAVVVAESSQPQLLTAAQTAWLISPKLRADAKAKGLDFHLVDPNQTDRDGKTPAELAPAIALAVKRGIPRLILVGPRGGLTDFLVPKDEATARARLQIGGGS